MKRSLSFLLAIVIVLTVFMAVAEMSGIDLVSASGFSDELWILNGRVDMLSHGVKTDIPSGGASYSVGDTAMLPLSAITKYLDYDITYDGDLVIVDTSKLIMTIQSGNTAYSHGTLPFAPEIKDGEMYVSILSAVKMFGLASVYNSDIGLTVLSAYGRPAYDKSYSSLKVQIEKLALLLFEDPTGEDIYNDIENHVGVDTHPRILVDADRFAYLRDIYNSVGEGHEGGAELYKWTQYYVSRAESYYKALFKADENGDTVWFSDTAKLGVRQPYYLYDENGNRLVGVKEYTDSQGVTHVCQGSGLGDGYDVGGRSAVESQTSKLKFFGFAYQITGDEKFVDAFYLLGTEVGKWEHWGEGHFLNVADGSVAFAIGLDWIWHGFDEREDDRYELATILYEKGVMPGYYAMTLQEDKIHHSALMKGGWKVLTRTNNWQSVCSSGMVVSAITLMEFENFRDNCRDVASTYLKAVRHCLLQYAPDGAYIESPAYWKYGTETYFVMLASLTSSAGTDYGYYDTIGLRESCYYVHYICDSSGVCWNFHDGGSSIVGTGLFYLAAQVYNDKNIAYFRNMRLLSENPLTPDLLDVLFYKPGFVTEDAELDLDRSFKVLETATMRSSWEADSVFVGLHAGANNVAHGDVDSGNFFLKSGNVTWFGDQGSEDYNVGNYFNNTYRYFYYRKSAEAHNTVLIRNDTDLPHGQILNSQSQSYALLTDFYSEGDGAYAVADMRVQYGKKCTAAKRGLMFTNSRRTVVVRDEMSFSDFTNVTWVASTPCSVKLSDDGRTAYLTSYANDSNGEVLRVTLISDNPTLKFEYMQTGTLLPGTVTGANSGNPKASSPGKRLVINAVAVTEFNVSVVMDFIRHEDEAVGNDGEPISDWKITDDSRINELNKDIDYSTGLGKFKYSLSTIIRAMEMINNAVGVDKLKIAMDSCVYTTSINMENKMTAQKVAEFWELIDSLNEQIRKTNSDAEKFFFSFVGRN